MFGSPRKTRQNFLLDIEDLQLEGVPEFGLEVSLDFETYSDIDLKKVGGSRYARHPSTEVLMLSALTSEGELIQWVPAEGERCPERMLSLLLDATTMKFAWNARFELDIFRHVLGYDFPLDQWKCVMVMAASQALPMDLSSAGDVIGLPEDQKKISDGKRLIKKFSVPRKPTKKDKSIRRAPGDAPEDWEKYKEYNRGDVVTERKILEKIRHWDLPEHEWHLWRIDQKINNTGVPINRRMVENAVQIYNDIYQDRIFRMKSITELENPNSQPQLLEWLRDRGYPWPDLKKGHVEDAIKNYEEYELSEGVYRVLVMRSEIGRTSVKKYQALLDATDDDDRLRGCLQFAGAGRTLRWAGRRFQPQNLARPTAEYEDRIHYAARLVEESWAWAIEQIHDTPMDLLSSCIRSAVQAPPGYELQDADLNAIENRVLGWVSNCEKIMQVFRDGKDPYLSFATYMYSQDYDTLKQEKDAGDKTKRTIAKPGVLGAGYMLSAGKEVYNSKTGEYEKTGLWGYAASMGIEMSQSQAEFSVRTFRETFTEVVQTWWALDKAARGVIHDGRPRRVNKVVFDRSGPYMRIKLPSGRYLHYLRPKLMNRKTPWGEMRLQITYEGQDQTTRKWQRISTHPGKIVENIVQAISRDLLANAIQLAHDKYGLEIIMHVHDQIVTMAPEDESQEALEKLNECLETRPSWAPDLPLKSEGFTDTIFRKD